MRGSQVGQCVGARVVVGYHDNQIICSYHPKPEPENRTWQWQLQVAGKAPKGRPVGKVDQMFYRQLFKRAACCLLPSQQNTKKKLLKFAAPFGMVMEIIEPAGVATLSGSMIRLMNGSQRLVINQMLHSQQDGKKAEK